MRNNMDIYLLWLFLVIILASTTTSDLHNVTFSQKKPGQALADHLAAVTTEQSSANTEGSVERTNTQPGNSRAINEQEVGETAYTEKHSKDQYSFSTESMGASYGTQDSLREDRNADNLTTEVYKPRQEEKLTTVPVSYSVVIDTKITTEDNNINIKDPTTDSQEQTDFRLTTTAAATPIVRSPFPKDVTVGVKMTKNISVLEAKDTKVNTVKSEKGTQSTASPLKLVSVIKDAPTIQRSSGQTDVDNNTVSSDTTQDFSIGITRDQHSGLVDTMLLNNVRENKEDRKPTKSPKGDTDIKPTYKHITSPQNSASQGSVIYSKAGVKQMGSKNGQANLSYKNYLDANETREANQLVKLVLAGKRSDFEAIVASRHNQSSSEEGEGDDGGRKKSLLRMAPLKTSLVQEWAAAADWEEEANAMGLHLSANTVAKHRGDTPLHIIVLLGMVTLIIFSLVTVSVLWRTRDYHYVSRNLLPLRHYDRARRY